MTKKEVEKISGFTLLDRIPEELRRAIDNLKSVLKKLEMADKHLKKGGDEDD